MNVLLSISYLCFEQVNSRRLHNRQNHMSAEQFKCNPLEYLLGSKPIYYVLMLSLCTGRRDTILLILCAILCTFSVGDEYHECQCEHTKHLNT